MWVEADQQACVQDSLQAVVDCVEFPMFEMLRGYPPVLHGQAEPGYHERSDHKVNRLDDAHGVLSGGCGGAPILLPEPRDGKRRKSLTANEYEIINRDTPFSRLFCVAGNC